MQSKPATLSRTYALLFEKDDPDGPMSFTIVWSGHQSYLILIGKSNG